MDVDVVRVFLLRILSVLEIQIREKKKMELKVKLGVRR